MIPFPKNHHIAVVQRFAVHGRRVGAAEEDDRLRVQAANAFSQFIGGARGSRDGGDAHYIRAGKPVPYGRAQSAFAVRVLKIERDRIPVAGVSADAVKEVNGPAGQAIQGVYIACRRAGERPVARGKRFDKCDG